MIKRVNSRHLAWMVLISSLLAFSACTKKETPSKPTKSVTAVIKPKVPTPQAVSVQKQLSSVKVDTSKQFDFRGKKDPFVPFIVPPEPTAKASPPAMAIKRTDLLPIQSYDVSKFTLSGIIVGMRENKALIVDPAGKGYVVKEGMLMGSNDGRISKISASSIEVVERYQEGGRRFKSRKIVLPLTKKKQGDKR